jgi:DUF1365 family protein
MALTDDASFFHLLKNDKAVSTSQEIIFLLCARAFGISEANSLAAKFHWKCQRPLRALRTMVDGQGRSYSMRGTNSRRV